MGKVNFKKLSLVRAMASSVILHQGIMVEILLKMLGTFLVQLIIDRFLEMVNIQWEIDEWID